MMSENIYNFAKDRIQSKSTNALFVIGKEDDIGETVGLFIDYVNPSCNSTLVYYAAERNKTNICLKNKGFQLLNKRIFKWSLADELLEVFGKPCFNEEIDSLHEGDQSRSTRMRLNRLLNRRIANFLFQRVKISPLECKLFLFTWPLLILGLFLKLSRLKPKHDELSEFRDLKNNRIYVFRSQMYEKDHYGESPLDIQKRKQIVQACMHILSDYSQVGVMVFIGQRVRWWHEIAGSVKQLKFNNATFFVFSAWRNSHKQEFKRVSGGEYYVGSNIDLHTNRIFSPHCVSIGALDHELWYKEVSKSRK
jgi:hypothetical protein